MINVWLTFQNKLLINAWILQKKVLTIKNKEKDLVILDDFREILSETLCKIGSNESMSKKRGRPSNIFGNYI